LFFLSQFRFLFFGSCWQPISRNVSYYPLLTREKTKKFGASQGHCCARPRRALRSPDKRGLLLLACATATDAWDWFALSGQAFVGLEGHKLFQVVHNQQLSSFLVKNRRLDNQRLTSKSHRLLPVCSYRNGIKRTLSPGQWLPFPRKAGKRNSCKDFLEKQHGRRVFRQKRVSFWLWRCGYFSFFEQLWRTVS
jgi:hypothetical protein